MDRKFKNSMGGNTMKMNKKGFTLIELLIVVAIIAILAAIAIPQFSQYRIKGYNGAATSDIRNARTAEEALFADYQGYGDDGGAIVTTSPVTLTTTDTGGVNRTVTTGLSNNVHMSARTPLGGGSSGANYLLFAKHVQGDRIFGADSNVTTIYWYSDATIIPGAIMVDPGYAPTNNADITVAGWTGL
jgi:prepilin-type N-terminal cleavage/methylation domain-containing protein